MSDLPLIAQHAGLCPLCGRYIAPNSSRIAPLAAALPPRPDLCRYGVNGTKGWYVANVPANVRRRRWAHARCVDSLDARYSADEQIALSADWAEELSAMRKRAEDEYRHRFGQPRKARAARAA